MNDLAPGLFTNHAERECGEFEGSDPGVPGNRRGTLYPESVYLKRPFIAVQLEGSTAVTAQAGGRALGFKT